MLCTREIHGKSEINYINNSYLVGMNC